MNQLGEFKDMNITGYLIPFEKGINAPILVTIETINFLPVYSTEEKLRESMKEIKIDEYDIKQIDNGDEFLLSVKDRVRVAANVHNKIKDGIAMVGFTEVVHSSVNPKKR